MTANGHRWRSVVAPFLVLLATTTADAESAGSPSVGHTVIEDFKYIVDNAQLDLRDIVTSPLSITSEDSVFRSAHFYLAFAGVGALWGGSFALDHIMRNNLHHMSSSDADLLQNISYGSISSSSAALYAYGFYSDDSRTRQYMLTGGEAAGLASLANGRMGHDAHWFSDVVGAGLLGWGTSELFLYLHKQHENQPQRWRIFPMTAPPTGASAARDAAPTGIALEYRW